MKIREIQRIAPSEIEKTYKTPAAKRASNPAQATESVKVSAEARALAAAREPEVPDQQKIEKLKDAIRKGEFKVDVGHIADAILNEEV
jgi:flagellar biosynthesis anti-sigma factor FlgM